MNDDNNQLSTNTTMTYRNEECRRQIDDLTPIYDENGRRMKHLYFSETESSHLLFPKDMNCYGRLFGGQLLQWMDETAGIVAKRHSESVVVTAAIDNLRFLRGASENDIIFMHGYLTYVGNTSMEVQVDTYCEHKDGTRTLINRAFFVMVAVDANGKPIQVPGLIVETINEKLRWEGAKKRNELRKRRQKEGY